MRKRIKYQHKEMQESDLKKNLIKKKHMKCGGVGYDCLSSIHWLSR